LLKNTSMSAAKSGKKARVKRRFRPSTDEELAAAAARGRIEKVRHGARAVKYNPRADEIEIALNTGVVVRIPREIIPGLEDASPKDLARVRLSPLTTSLRFDTLDADYAVHGLLRKVMGLNEQQRAAGAVTSAAKRIAAATNGKRSGRRKAVSASRGQRSRAPF
jgi:hypothetical protein